VSLARTWVYCQAVRMSVRARRRRLGLSAEDFGKLVGVTPLTIYHWEHGKSRPRPAQFARLVAVRGIGKRDYHNARLKEFCDRHQIPLADICSRLRDEHFGDELHPNDQGAKIIAEEFREVLPIQSTTLEP